MTHSCLFLTSYVSGLFLFHTTEHLWQAEPRRDLRRFFHDRVGQPGKHDADFCGFCFMKKKTDEASESRFSVFHWAGQGERPGRISSWIRISTVRSVQKRDCRFRNPEKLQTNPGIVSKNKRLAFIWAHAPSRQSNFAAFLFNSMYRIETGDELEQTTHPTVADYIRTDFHSLFSHFQFFFLFFLFFLSFSIMFLSFFFPLNVSSFLHPVFPFKLVPLSSFSFSFHRARFLFRSFLPFSLEFIAILKTVKWTGLRFLRCLRFSRLGNRPSLLTSWLEQDLKCWVPQHYTLLRTV